MLNIITITKDDFVGLFRTVKSSRLLRERYGVKQIIIDGSKNSHKQRNIEYIKKLKNIEYYWQKPSGISKAFNFGLSKSDSKWTWFLNGGDEVFKSIDYSMFFSLLKNSSADLMIFETEESGKEIKHPPLHLLWPPLLDWVPHQATLIRRDIFNKFGNFKKTFAIAMDADLWLRLFSRYDVVVDMISLPIAVFYQGGIHANSRVTAREMLKAIWINKVVLIRRSINRFCLLVKAFCFYIAEAFGLKIK